MLKEQCKYGMHVRFGRPNGEKTTGTVDKLNNIRAKIKIDFARGQSPAGTYWNVPYSMLEPVEDSPKFNPDCPRGKAVVKDGEFHRILNINDGELYIEKYNTFTDARLAAKNDFVSL